MRIGIFSGEFLNRLTLNITTSGYESNGEIIAKGEILKIELQGDSLKVQNLAGKKYIVKRFELTANSEICNFRIKADQFENRQYYGSLEIKVIRGVMRLVNTTDNLHYIAGVVDAETGPKGAVEFYKVQAILARTFAFENVLKHQDFGFNLCDQVHCQVFKGTEIRSPNITLGVERTKDLVLYENGGRLAFAPYHSNCGGQTETSENVWGGKLPHLQQITDSFCIFSNKAKWETHVSLEKWNKWLIRQHLEPMIGQTIDWEQIERKKEIKLGGKTFATRKLRTDFGLSSSYFNLKTTFQDVVFTGKGYGHGVGVCQQGAIRMADLGYNYENIIKHYYKGLVLGKLK